jgi:hypothetical protein
VPSAWDSRRYKLRTQLAAEQLRTQLAAENVFLRKQLALYLERQVKPRRATETTRLTLVALSRFVNWRPLVVIVAPETLIRWHRKAFRLLWRWKSQRPGRPPIPAHLRQLIAQMATANRTWGEERIAHELLLKLGIRVSRWTVRRYMRNHARPVLASHFFVVVTATFRAILCVGRAGSRHPSNPALERDRAGQPQ